MTMSVAESYNGLFFSTLKLDQLLLTSIPYCLVQYFLLFETTLK